MSRAGCPAGIPGLCRVPRRFIGIDRGGMARGAVGISKRGVDIGLGQGADAGVSDWFQRWAGHR